jgi:SAM-dependent methyltransferase
MADGPAGFAGKLRRIRFSIASTGLRRALADLGTRFLGVRNYDAERDRSFDRRFGTDTAGRVAPEQLGIADGVAREQAILYLPSPERVTRWMLANAGIDHRDYTFVDMGCGKGRVILVAATYPFQRVVGVEISAPLAKIARANIDRFQPPTRKCRNVEVHTVDATRFAFPETNLLIHFYHPFEPPLLNAVLEQLQRSIDARPRKVVIAYLLYADALESVETVFARFPWLKRVRHEQSVLGQYDWLFYEGLKS